MINATAQRLAAAAFVAFALLVVADNDATAELAVAFAYLILLSAALTTGPTALARLTQLWNPVVPGTAAFSKAHRAPGS